MPTKHHKVAQSKGYQINKIGESLVSWCLGGSKWLFGVVEIYIEMRQRSIQYRKTDACNEGNFFNNKQS